MRARGLAVAVPMCAAAGSWSYVVSGPAPADPDAPTEDDSNTAFALPAARR